MAKVSVSSEAVEQTMQRLAQMRGQIQTTSQTINGIYRQAGAEWNDQKYQQLGQIIADVTQALSNVEPTLTSAEAKLRKILNAINTYNQS